MPAYCGQAEAKFRQYSFHPVCEMFPWMSEPEFLALAEDIKTNGLIEAITRYKDQIVDGKHRLTACLIAGVKPRFAEWDGQGSLISWIASKNLPRRHLTPSQRAAIAVDLLPELEKDAKERQREGGRVAKNGATIPVAGKASQFAAKVAGTNYRYVEAVKAIQKQAPELIDEIRVGNLTVRDAGTLARLPEARRNAVTRVVKQAPDRNLDEIIGKVVNGRSGARPITSRNGATNGKPFNFRKPFETWEKSDEYYTPAYALDPLLPYLLKGATIWEGAWGRGHLAGHLKQAGFRVAGSPKMDFLQEQPRRWDILVTNPPYSQPRKDEFIARAYSLGKPFALLLPIDALSGEYRHQFYRERGLELLVPNRRIDFIVDGEQTDAANFATAWFCWRLLPERLICVDLAKR